MTNCPFCKAAVGIKPQDFGRGRIEVLCCSCGHFDTHREAVSHIVSSRFGKRRRIKFQQTIKELQKLGIKAEVVVLQKSSGKEIVSRAMR